MTSFFGKRIGEMVILSKDVPRFHVWEMLGKTTCLLVEPLKGFIFHFVGSCPLFHNQLAIGTPHKLRSIVFHCGFQPANEGAIFGNVVGCVSYGFADTVEYLSIFIHQNGTNASRPRVAARGSIGIKEGFHGV